MLVPTGSRPAQGDRARARRRGPARALARRAVEDCEASRGLRSRDRATRARPTPIVRSSCLRMSCQGDRADLRDGRRRRRRPRELAATRAGPRARPDRRRASDPGVARGVEAVLERLGARRVDRVEMPPLGVSSSMIRARVAAGKPIRWLVPDGSRRTLIAERGLYRRGGRDEPESSWRGRSRRSPMTSRPRTSSRSKSARSSATPTSSSSAPPATSAWRRRFTTRCRCG